jgi:hypothetical protein
MELVCHMVESPQECVSEFISFITSEAADRAAGEKRRTLTGDDALAAFNSLGFENYGEVVKIYLAKYRTVRSAPTFTDAPTSESCTASRGPG